VCQHSIEENTESVLDIQMLKQQDLRAQEIYTRLPDEKASTEFTFTRFLVPKLMQYRGWAVFCDCDFLWIDDIEKLFEQADDRYAVMVVKHDYRPQNKTKMDGQRQEYYPRKNWSSMILWNCEHPKNRQLDETAVAEWPGSRLHRFEWLDDSDIGSLAPAWNWLVGWYHEPWDGKPSALHYTEGGPWFDNYRNCDYSHLWKFYEQQVTESRIDTSVTAIRDLDLPRVYKHFFTNVLEYVENPNGKYGETATRAQLIRWLDDRHKWPVIGISEEEDVTKKMKTKGARWDPIVHAFVQGAAGSMSPWNDIERHDSPIALRSIAKKKIMQQCLDTGRDFYYIDTGYFGNNKRKEWHRITKNAMQWLGAIEKRPTDRIDRIGLKIKPMTPGSKILICPPSAKALSYWGLEEESWLENTIAEIKQHTDREIVVRLKQNRSVRATVDTMEMALANDIHCMVTFNSIAAVESLIYGKPVFTMGPNAAHHLSNTNLADIENPRCPDTDEVRALMACLSYHQFTVQEMQSGFAWESVSRG
jgi:lipopolysaccharide biosynthesis glycosyltransferase